MSYVNSSSSRSEVAAAMADNAAFDVVGDSAMAGRYLVAARIWLTNHAYDRSVEGPSEMEFTEQIRSIRQMMGKAEQFVAQATAGTGGTILLSTEDFRG